MRCFFLPVSAASTRFVVVLPPREPVLFRFRSESLLVAPKATRAQSPNSRARHRVVRVLARVHPSRFLINRQRAPDENNYATRRKYIYIFFPRVRTRFCKSFPSFLASLLCFSLPFNVRHNTLYFFLVASHLFVSLLIHHFVCLFVCFCFLRLTSIGVL